MGLAQRGVRGVTTDDDPVYGPALDASGLDRQQCAVHMQHTVGCHIHGLDKDALTHLDRVLLPILQRLARKRPIAAGPVLLALWQAVAQGEGASGPEGASVAMASGCELIRLTACLIPYALISPVFS